MSIRVLLDATAIPRDRGGVGRYIDGLLDALSDEHAGVAAIAHPVDAAVFATRGIEVIPAPWWIDRAPLRLVWEQMVLPGIVSRGRFDVLHSPHYTFPMRGRFGRVVTIHDLTFFTLPAAHNPLKRLWFKSWLRRLAKESFPVVAVSHATADAFVDLLHADRSRITVALHGCDGEIFRVPEPAEVAEFAKTLHPPVDNWITFLGTFEPRKNVAALVKAHASLGPGAPTLLLAGGPGWDPAAGPAIEASRAGGADVRTLGYVPIEQLRALLGGAEIVAYPSLGEGFGLPVLEAMASGACVLTTRELALPEVGGDAVAYSTTSADDLAASLTALMSDPDRRKALGNAAVKRAAGFTWKAAAAAHMDAYRDAV